ncbi:MAG: M48 family metalloprotease, partial [Actinomycetota bacterium]|nr:M48 family metalloprotease [Actinomycetota bacterium]
MSTWRAVLIVALVAFGSAGLLAFVSRTPSEIRNVDEASQSTDASLGARFDRDQIARHGAYRGPIYLSFFLGLALEVAVLLVLALGPLPELVRRLEGARGGVVLHAAVLGAVVALALGAAALPLSFVRGYAMQHAWGLSTQNLLQWFDDLGRGLLVSGVIAALSTAAFFAVVRWQPKTWWIFGWLTFTVLTALLVFIYPVVIAPLFNKFTPIEDTDLATKIRAMATEAGVNVDEVLVADASRRTTAENAYVAGLGQTKRVVLYDTLLEGGGEDETLFVVA